MEIRWAGFVDDDAILIATATSLHRAATPADAIAGTLEALPALDPAATMIASSGKIVVTVAPGPDGALQVSTDGGRHFKPEKRPASGSIVDLAVRADEVVTVAYEVGAPFKPGTRGEADVYTRKGKGAWKKGPSNAARYSTVFTHRGDSITVYAPSPSGDSASSRVYGIDAKGAFIVSTRVDAWLSETWTSGNIVPRLPVARPGVSRPLEEGEADQLGGLVGGLAGGSECHGFGCLARRLPVGPPASLRAFPDGQCDKAHMLTHHEMIDIVDALPRGSRKQSHDWSECDPSKPVKRGATLVVGAGDDARFVRLPLSCGGGEITGTDRASFVYCSGKYRGRPSLHRLGPTGALTEVAPSVPSGLDLVGAESVSDGTTVVFADKATWVCSPDASCVLVPHEGFVAARPLPGGRALVVRKGARDEGATLELFGEASALPVPISAQGNVLDVEVTAEGAVRLWTSRTLSWLPSLAAFARRKDNATIEPFLVELDGHLRLDARAQEAWARAVADARAAAPASGSTH